MSRLKERDTRYLLLSNMIDSFLVYGDMRKKNRYLGREEIYFGKNT
jgi:hypothetical protein